MMKRLGVLLLLGACGAGNDYDGINHGPATTVHLTTAAAPALVAIKDGTAATWQTPTQVSPTAYDAVVHGPYLMTVVCAVDETPSTPSTTWRTQQWWRTPEDDTSLTTLCGPRQPAVTRHHVRGRVLQDMSVQIGDRGGDVKAGESFSFDVPAGTYDLYALSATAILARHDIEVNDDAEIAEALDLASEGAAFVDLPVNPANNHGTLFVQTSFASTPTTYTQGLFSRIDVPGGVVKIAPASVVGARDKQRLSLSTGLGVGLTQQIVAGDHPEFRVPDPLSLQWATDALSATWDGLDDGDEIGLASYGNIGDAAGEHSLAISAQFREETGTSRAQLDLTFPGAGTEGQLAGPIYSYFSAARVEHDTTVYRQKMYPQLD